VASDNLQFKAVFKGDKETIDFLQNLGYAIIRGPGGGPVGISLKEAGEPLAEKVRDNAPVDQGVLRKSIKLSRMKGRTRTSINFGLVMRSVRTAAARKRSGSKSLVPFYWYFLEYGWVAANGQRYQYPFIRPVVYSQFDATVDRFSDRLYVNLKTVGLK
jgi:hypothetical protein